MDPSSNPSAVPSLTPSFEPSVDITSSEPTSTPTTRPAFWTQLGGDIDGEAFGDYSGHSVSFSSDGKTVAIGAIYNDGAGSNAGHVRVFTFNSSNNQWTQLGGDIDGKAPGDFSGWIVSISSDGKTVAIGAPYNDVAGIDAGHVRVYSFI